MTPAKIYPFSIPAGGSFPLLVIGDYCKILSSTGPLTITGDTFGTLGPILAGQGVGDMPFKRLMLTDNTGAINTGTILIADEKFIDDRVTGEVSVIDGGKSRTIANMSIVGAATETASVGNFSQIQFWNPVGSGHRMILSVIFASRTTNGIILVRSHDAEVGNYSGAAISKLNKNTKAEVWMNTYVGAAILGQAVNRLSVMADSTITWQLREPIVITPGFGLMVTSMDVNVGVTAGIEGYLEPI